MEEFRQSSDRKVEGGSRRRMKETVGRQEGANGERVSPHPLNRGC